MNGLLLELNRARSEAEDAGGARDQLRSQLQDAQAKLAERDARLQRSGQWLSAASANLRQSIAGHSSAAAEAELTISAIRQAAAAAAKDVAGSAAGGAVVASGNGGGGVRLWDERSSGSGGGAAGASARYHHRLTEDDDAGASWGRRRSSETHVQLLQHPTTSPARNGELPEEMLPLSRSMRHHHAASDTASQSSDGGGSGSPHAHGRSALWPQAPTLFNAVKGPSAGGARGGGSSAPSLSNALGVHSRALPDDVDLSLSLSDLRRQLAQHGGGPGLPPRGPPPVKDSASSSIGGSASSSARSTSRPPPQTTGGLHPLPTVNESAKRLSVAAADAASLHGEPAPLPAPPLLPSQDVPSHSLRILSPMQLASYRTSGVLRGSVLADSIPDLAAAVASGRARPSKLSEALARQPTELRSSISFWRPIASTSHGHDSAAVDAGDPRVANGAVDAHSRGKHQRLLGVVQTFVVPCFCTAVGAFAVLIRAHAGRRPSNQCGSCR